jgi:hypothetical protein
MKKNLSLAFTFIMVSTILGIGQPTISTKIFIGQTAIFQDFKKKNLFYYLPIGMALSTEVNGKPKFSLLSMRFTGSQVTSNSGEKRFTNLIQFTVKLENPSVESLRKIKDQLKGNDVKLMPFPIRNIENNLVAFFTNKSKEIGNSASTITEKSEDNQSFWTERVLNFKLDNADAQLLIDQIATGKCILSFNYAFVGDCILGLDGVVNAKRNKSQISESISSEMVKDTIVKTQIVSADVLQIALDFNRFPDLIKKIDLNEEVPPAYALLEVRCYDFLDNLRPDLYMKTIEFQAVGVNGKPVKLPAKRFLKSRPDLTSLQIQFPFAIRMYQPLSYKITDYFLNGQRTEGPWISKNSFSELIDISTPLDTSLFSKHTFQAEIGWEEVPLDSIENVQLDFKYFYKDVEKRSIIEFKSNDFHTKSVDLLFDKKKQVAFQIIIKFSNQNRILFDVKTKLESYNYVNLNQYLASN